MRAAVEKVTLAHSVITEFDSLAGRVTVPGRAHQLVQHGAHLGLRRHLERGGGPARPGRLTPTAAYKARGAARPEALPLRVTARARAEPCFPAEGAGGTRRAARAAGAATEGGAERSGGASAPRPARCRRLPFLLITFSKRCVSWLTAV